MMESESYRVLNRRVKDRQVNSTDMGPAIDYLDKAIKEDTMLLAEGKPDRTTANALRNSIILYQSWRSKLSDSSRTNGSIPVPKPGCTDMLSDDEYHVLRTLEAYNREVQQTAPYAQRIKRYESMMRSYRKALVSQSGFNHGRPTNQALKAAERLAYIGFTDTDDR